MSNSVTAVCNSRKELFDGIRLSVFQYAYKYEGVLVLAISDSFNIITEDHDLRLEWTIQRSYTFSRPEKCNWNKVSFQSDQKVFGNFIVTNELDRSKKYVFSTSELSPSFEQNLTEAYCCFCTDLFITITFEVYRQDDRVNSVFGDYNRFLENKETSDVTIVVGDEEFSVHKQILSARSEVFAKMFETNMSERKTGRVEIADIESTTFKLLLNFIYSLELNSNDTVQLLELVVAADKYSVRSLVNSCGFRLANNLTVDNAAEVLIISDLVKANFLKKDCMIYIMKNKDKIGETEGYKKLVESPDLLSEMFLLVKKKYLTE